MTEVRPGDDPGGVRHLRLPAQPPTARSRRRRPSSTPFPPTCKSDRHNLPAGRYTLVRIPIDPIAHAFRAGTRLRIVISAPGGDRPSWAFDTPATHGSVTDTVSLGGAMASSLAVNVVHGVKPTAAMPACGALRGEPCRPYSKMANQG